MTLQVRAQVSLKPFNSFGIDVRARLFAEAHNDADVREALACAAEQQLPLLVIGGGSNLLLTQDIDALVLRMASQGIRVLHDDGVQVVVEAEAGEAWHPFVLWTLAQGFSGLELCLPRQPVQARSGALADPAGAFCPEPCRASET